MTLVAFSFILVACNVDEAGEPASQSVIDVDPTFREYYEQLGGIETLGPAISPLFVAEDHKYQYTQSALLVTDPEAPGGQRIHLAPLGMEMNVSEPAVIQPERANAKYVDGHIIYGEFVSLYEKMGGSRHLGPPISEVHYNPEIKRYEQYFQNVGMYISETDPSGEPHLLAYGAWKCDYECRQQPLDGSQVILPNVTDQHFTQAVTRLGIDFTGYAISDAYRTPDGYIEQVFSNVVLVADPQSPSRVFLRPVTESIGILSDPLAEPNGEAGYYFYPIQGEDRGYNVPGYFWDYMALHGGQEASGPPITELSPLRNNVYRQCFVNLCLEVRMDDPDNPQIRPSQLGYSYKEFALEPVVQNQTQAENPAVQLPEPAPTQPDQSSPSTPSDEGESLAPSEVIEAPNPDQPQPALPTQEVFLDMENSMQVSIQVWESYPMLAQNQSQEIGVSISENGVPVRGIEPDLLIELPQGRTKNYYMFPTGEDGQTRMRIDPINESGGTLIPYQVCIFYPGGQRFCVKDSFVIWENP